MRLLVCGGRTFSDKALLFATLDRVTPRTEPDEYGNTLPAGVTIIHGAAQGADRLADDWAVVNWCSVEQYPADWDRYKKSAGFIRNQEMLEKGRPDLVIAFPGGRGTADMVRRARKAGVPVTEVKNNLPDPLDLGDEHVMNVLCDESEGIKMAAVMDRPVTIDLNKVARAYIKLRNKRAELKSAFDEQDAGLKEKQAQLEAAMLQHFNANNVESVRTTAGTIYRQIDVKPSCQDWQAFYGWVKDHDGFDFLEQRLKKATIKQFMEVHDGALPPGVSVHQEYVVRVRKG